MPEVTITIPPQFLDSVKKLTGSMQNYSQFAQRMKTAIQPTPTKTIPRSTFHPNQLAGMFQRMDHLLKRFDTTVVRSIDQMLFQLGPNARTMVRRITNVSTMLGDVSPVIRAAGRLGFLGEGIGAVGRMGGGTVFVILAAIALVAKAMKWLWDKSLGISESMIKDNVQALAVGMSIGGLRALRVTMTGFPDIDQLIANTQQITGRATSDPSLLVHFLLGVRAYKDSAEMTIQSVLMARRFLRNIPQSQLLSRAEDLGFLNVFTTKQVIALVQMSDEEALQWATFFAASRQGLTPNPEAVEALIRLNRAMKRLWFTIVNRLGESLARSKVPEALIHLAEAMTIFLKRVLNSQTMGALILHLQKGIDRLTDWLNKDWLQIRYDIQVVIDDFRTRLSEWTSILDEALAKIKGELYLPELKVRAPIIPHYPPSYPFGSRGLSIGPAGGPVFRGSRSGGPGFRPSPPPPLKFPTSVEEGSENIAESIKRGQSRSMGSTTGAGTQPRPPGATPGTYRPEYHLSNADLSDAVVGTIAGEAYTNNQESVDAVINNMLNRVGSRGWGPSGNLQDVASARGQYSAYGHRASSAEAEYIRSRIRAIASGQVRDNTDGSNQYRASGVGYGGRGRWNDGRPTLLVGGNRFAYDPASRNGPYAPYNIQAGTSGLEHMTISDIARLRDNTSSVSGSPAPDAKAAPSGDTRAVVLHHTGSHASPAEIVAEWRREGRGIGAQFIVDRDGVVHDVEKEFGYTNFNHVSPAHTPQSLKDQGYVNRNMVGIEIIANNDSDVNQSEITGVTNFVRKGYNSVPVLTHGYLNPIEHHRQPTEGKTVAEAIRADRANKQPGTHKELREAPPLVDGKKPPMYIFRGLNGLSNDTEAAKTARDRGFEPVFLNSIGRGHAASELKTENDKRGGGQFGVYGFSAGASAVDEVLGTSELKDKVIPGGIVVVSPYHKADLSNVEARPDVHLYPDKSSAPRYGPRGDGFDLFQRHMDTQEEVNREPSPPKIETQEPASTGIRSGNLVVEAQGEEASIRKQPITPEVREQLEYAAAKTGVTVKVFSGGQDPSGVYHTGSHRHDHGNAADVYLYDTKDGHILRMDNATDATRMAEFTKHTVSAGATGVGAGEGYMGASGIHIGGGRATHWGGAGWIPGAWEAGIKTSVTKEEIRRVIDKAKGGSTPVSGYPASYPGIQHFRHIQSIISSYPRGYPGIDNLIKGKDVKENTDNPSIIILGKPTIKTETPPEKGKDIKEQPGGSTIIVSGKPTVVSPGENKSVPGPPKDIKIDNQSSNYTVTSVPSDSAHGSSPL